MGTFWGFAGWWCLIPFAFMILLAIGCFLFMRRSGGCASTAVTGCCGRREPDAPRKPA